MGDWSRSKEYTARKVYRCEFCRMSILPGERYARVARVIRGKFKSRTRCIVCDRMARDYERETGEVLNSAEDLSYYVRRYCRGCWLNGKDCQMIPERCSNIRRLFYGEF